MPTSVFALLILAHSLVALALFLLAITLCLVWLAAAYLLKVRRLRPGRRAFYRGRPCVIAARPGHCLGPFTIIPDHKPQLELQVQAADLTLADPARS